MDRTSREIAESPLWQGADEEIAYDITTTPWGTAPSDVAVKLFTFDGDTYTDVSAGNLSGAVAVAGDVITTPTVKSLVAGTTYQLEVKFTSGGNIFEVFAHIVGQR
jgi:hypothetical protein